MTAQTKPLFIHHRRVEFADTDAGGIVHFSRFHVFMETAEHEMLRQRGIEPAMEIDGKPVTWPRVETRCRYVQPARLGDDLAIEVRLGARGRTSMTYAFRVLCGDDLLAEGEMTSVCCILAPGTPPQPIPFPDQLAERLPAAP